MAKMVKMFHTLEEPLGSVYLDQPRKVPVQMSSKTDTKTVSPGPLRSRQVTIFRPFAVTAPSRLVQEMSGFSTRQGRDLTKFEVFGIHRKMFLNAFYS